jgi:hypothetical protein
VEGSHEVRVLAGWSLVGVGTALWIAVPVVLALSIDGGLKATVVGALLVIAEVAFWAGAVLLGIGLFARLKAAYARRRGRRDDAAGEDETPDRGETPSRKADEGEPWA